MGILTSCSSIKALGFDFFVPKHRNAALNFSKSWRSGLQVEPENVHVRLSSYDIFNVLRYGCESVTACKKALEQRSLGGCGWRLPPTRKEGTAILSGHVVNHVNSCRGDELIMPSCGGWGSYQTLEGVSGRSIDNGYGRPGPGPIDNVLRVLKNIEKNTSLLEEATHREDIGISYKVAQVALAVIAARFGQFHQRGPDHSRSLSFNNFVPGLQGGVNHHSFTFRQASFQENRRSRVVSYFTVAIVEDGDIPQLKHQGRSEGIKVLPPVYKKFFIVVDIGTNHWTLQVLDERNNSIYAIIKLMVSQHLQEFRCFKGTSLQLMALRVPWKLSPPLSRTESGLSANKLWIWANSLEKPPMQVSGLLHVPDDVLIARFAQDL
ncbi:hypothetical protein HUJ04_011906 [Dendroctonus ponderosae]|nr:hypothetical protein HUJ04_011906 [Dendroctonus ponderosae]KAH1029020.1 hypothetical protein HUJ05_002326 [Dendroctonus ponderosae]